MEAARNLVTCNTGRASKRRDKMANAFGEFVKARRLACGLTLRVFCENNGFDPGNVSRLERGLTQPPHDEKKLSEYGLALGLTAGTDDWQEFFDCAAAARGEIPRDLMADDQVVEKLPLLFRTLRGDPVRPERLDELVDKIRRS
jgi:transcriptional regulator with XRE-family HTH domain